MVSATRICQASFDGELNTVHAAPSDFSDGWPDPVVRLPPELVSEIFRELDFAGRVCVSHVCTAWRAAALADRALWAEFLVSDPNGIYSDAEVAAEDAEGWEVRANAHALSVLLARSSPLPFTLRADYVPDAVAEIIIANIDRMGCLRLDNFQRRGAVRRLLALDVPVLKSFRYYFHDSSNGPLSLSPRWIDGSAPCLQHLDLSGSWLWPAGFVANSLRSFSGTLPEGVDGTWSVSDLFPNLSELFLSGGAVVSAVAHLDPLPLTLASMTLVPMMVQVDYASILRNCSAPGLRLLDLQLTQPGDSLKEAEALFLRRFAGQWALRINYVLVVLSSLDADPPYRYELDADATSWLSGTPCVLFCWGRLCSLDVLLTNLLDLWKAIVPGATLPSLRTVRIAASWDASSRVLTLENGTYIDTPALASVAISIAENESTSLVPIATSITRAFRVPNLGSIEVVTDDIHDIRQEDLTELRGLADRLTFRNERGDTVTL